MYVEAEGTGGGGLSAKGEVVLLDKGGGACMGLLGGVMGDIEAATLKFVKHQGSDCRPLRERPREWLFCWQHENTMSWLKYNSNTSGCGGRCGAWEKGEGQLVKRN